MMLLSGVRPFEVPVSYYSRSHEQGRKSTGATLSGVYGF
jgi:hypothetical protein